MLAQAGTVTTVFPMVTVVPDTAVTAPCTPAYVLAPAGIVHEPAIPAITGAGFTTIESVVMLYLFFCASVTEMATGKVPLTVGVPLIVVPLKVTPLGNVPVTAIV